MAGKLEGKIAIVTGASAGIGLATAKRFAEEGAYVFITGRRQPELDAAVKEIGPRATGVRADSSDIADLAHFFETVKTGKGRIDVLFVNAGVYEFTPFGTITEDDIGLPPAVAAYRHDAIRPRRIGGGRSRA
jgi:NAD(P)-dependent dehydrogenase (short-subunit alcohol dehydrogenase family)